MELNQIQRIRYLEENGEYCPYCKSDDLTACKDSEMRSDGPLIWRGITCNSCKRTWTDIYVFAGIGDM
jgi:hypothetical protein